MDENLYPYVVEPKAAPAIWGGESWKCWDDNPVTNGPLAGKRIAELRAELGATLLGSLDPAQIFPVLTKIIDARQALSVQVHPDDAYARRVEHQHNGKTECWYILSATDDASLVLGWSQDTTRAEYERRVADGTLGDILRRVPVKAGDAFYLPAGTLHAIGAGIVLFETQQASDLTYRIFDWNRVGADGKPRQLHVQKAGDVLDYHRSTASATAQIAYRFEGLSRLALIADSRFVVERIVATEEPHSMSTHERPLIFMPLDRPLTIEAGGTTVTLEPEQCAIVPAAARWCTVSSDAHGGAHVMFVTPPASREAYAAQLLAAGVDQTHLDAFMAQFA
ncbi:MAG: class I mannose-6-phosphate isomerase [bacterium]|nr:class I mannose-6-phosphate isomerase [bacterium]